MSLFSQKQTALGLDLSDISVKIVELEKKSKGFAVIGYNRVDIPRGIMVNDVIMDEASLQKFLHNIFHSVTYGHLRTKNIVASVPESKAFVRVIQIPKMPEEQAAAAVPFEAEQFIPMPLEQVYLDWQIIAEHDEKLDVLVTAAPRDYIDNFLRVFKNAGLQPIAFEVESAACVRSLLKPEDSGKTRPTLILDFGTFRTSLITVEHGSLEYTLSVPISGNSLTQSLVKALGVKEDEAEKIKREIGLDESKEHQNVRTALASVIDSLVVEIVNSIKFHDEHSANHISQIILCGGSSKLLFLSSYLYQKLAVYPGYAQIDILVGNPWVNIFDPALKNPIPLSKEDSLDYTTAIGLALRGANLKGTK